MKTQTAKTQTAKPKPLEQIAYEAFAPGGAPWEKLPVLARMTWRSVASALEREIVRRLVDERQRVAESDPDRPITCRCGARHLRGEKHVCNDDPKLFAVK